MSTLHLAADSLDAPLRCCGVLLEDLPQDDRITGKKDKVTCADFPRESRGKNRRKRANHRAARREALARGEVWV